MDAGTRGARLHPAFVAQLALDLIRQLAMIGEAFDEGEAERLLCAGEGIDRRETWLQPHG